MSVNTPTAGSARRTVRLAVALAVTQVLLGSLIGWLTLGGATPTHRPGSTATGPVAVAVTSAPRRPPVAPPGAAQGSEPLPRAAALGPPTDPPGGETPRSRPSTEASAPVPTSDGGGRARCDARARTPAASQPRCERADRPGPGRHDGPRDRRDR